MTDFLFWLYLFNSVLLINHEIDSAQNQRMNQTGITCGFYRKGRAGLKGCRPAGYPSR